MKAVITIVIAGESAPVKSYNIDEFLRAKMSLRQTCG
jgi:hypothetical protein